MTSMYCGGFGCTVGTCFSREASWEIRRFDVKRPRTGVSALLGAWSFGLQEFADYLFYVAVLAVDGVV
jgi:hypothetical protein